MPAPGYEIGRKNKERVRQYFQEHLCATNRECAAALGMSEMAVGRHVAAIRSEWTTENADGRDRLRKPARNRHVAVA